ncbi:biliverdin-producing heme oxygenase [Pedobacter fastidiosus]|uniref:Biliverdin-producing heme oxygenase n=1 Tax=Pedobacter fastidiosus TaxID=2765361 RepID=A0ABR7KP01_9SPHI|nr:biliverdin-producing heme oxygenase [Pedobacter fastidiosus]MBC6109463.1 biliverdin-producing heme oxygenase [Pedobacter fastidiosus]
MIANILRAETADKHKELESLMFVNEIMNNSLSVIDYKKLLTINYIIHQKLENKLANMLDADLAEKLKMNDRLKLSSLEKDLQYWDIDNLTLPELNFELFIPRKNTAEVLGALYVLEGATLGGNVIKKHILANSNFATAEGGLNYYGVYGDELGTKWKNFVSILNESVSEADYKACVNSANETFENLIKLSKQLN